MPTHLLDGECGPQRFKMALDKDVEIRLRDGAIVRADVYRPDKPGRYPALISYGPYGKDSHISQFLGAETWGKLTTRRPGITGGTSGKYIVFERPNPEQWVLHDYALVHVDCRGAGRSPGVLDVNSPQEFRDFHEAIEWTGSQTWCSGKVGLLGISYYAAGQWMVASYRPKYLAAMLPWSGTCDFYRDRTRHGGIFVNGFVHRWWTRSVLNNQNGNPDTRCTDFIEGKRSTGEIALSEAQRIANRRDYIENVRAHPLQDAWYRERSGELSKIDIPALVVSNWGGLGLHLRGTIQGYVGIASREKWLKVQTGPYFATFFESADLQRRFFDRFLKGLDNGWDREPRVDLTVRSTDDKIHRQLQGSAWPLPGTRFKRLHLDAATKSLADTPPGAAAQLSYEALGEGVMLGTAPLERDLELAGPLKARLQVSCSKPDMDLFLTVLGFDASGREISFGANEGRIPLSQGWLRVTQRKLDPACSSDWQPVHTHDERVPLVPGEIVQADVELWPTSVLLPKGSRLVLVLQGRDWAGLGKPESSTSNAFTHNDPVDRPEDRYSGQHSAHTGAGRECWLQIPVIE